jgi:probable F420-dependent oxidoreductase
MTGVGICLPQLGPGITRSMLKDFCEKAEELGYTSLWVQEHMMVPVDPQWGYGGMPGMPIPEQYRSTLGPFELLTAAAAWTTTPLLGTSIIVGGYHRPVELAQRLATLDVISDGRIIAGLGIGWSGEEHAASDVDMKVRGRRMTELVEAVKACWGPDPVSFEGEFFTIPPSYINPKPVQSPRPPLVSGMWSEAGLKRTAAIFDGWNPTMGAPADVQAQLDGLNAQRPEGADPLSMWYRVFFGAPLIGGDDAEAVFEASKGAAEQGFDEVIIDANFSEFVKENPSRWVEVLDLLAPAIKAAQR